MCSCLSDPEEGDWRCARCRRSSRRARSNTRSVRQGSKTTAWLVFPLFGIHIIQGEKAFRCIGTGTCFMLSLKTTPIKKVPMPEARKIAWAEGRGEGPGPRRGVETLHTARGGAVKMCFCRKRFKEDPVTHFVSFWDSFNSFSGWDPLILYEGFRWSREQPFSLI